MIQGAKTIPKVDWNRAFEFTWRILVFIVAIGIIIVVSTNWTRWEGGAGWQTTNDAYLQADLTPISAKVGGYLRELPIQDYERVHKGQVLAQLVDDDYRAAVAQAQASIASATAQAQALKAQHELQLATIEAARAVVASTTASVEQNERDLARQQRLLQTGSSSTEASEKLETAHAQLTAQLAQNRAQASAAERQLRRARGAARSRARRRSPRRKRPSRPPSSISATPPSPRPRTGSSGSARSSRASWWARAAQITTLTPLPNVWVIANYKETQLTHMAVGQKAEITVDTFPGHKLRGHVLAFSPASGAEFALLPPDNATGNFTKVVQRIAVKIVIDDADGLADRLVPGMSVEARVDARDGQR